NLSTSEVPGTRPIRPAASWRPICQPFAYKLLKQPRGCPDGHVSRTSGMHSSFLASPVHDSRTSIQSDRHLASPRVYKIALRSGESSSHICSTILFACVRAQSEPSGPEQGSSELQVVILE